LISVIAVPDYSTQQIECLSESGVWACYSCRG
jgi:hypothetical protein